MYTIPLGKARHPFLPFQLLSTGAIFIGVGDFVSQEFNALGFREQELSVYGYQNISQVTQMPVVEDVVYIDKHPQPSHDTETMPGFMQKYHGQITGNLTA